MVFVPTSMAARIFAISDMFALPSRRGVKGV